MAQAAARQTDRVSVEELAGWIIEGRQDFEIVDVRSATDFDSGHIGEARNVPVAAIVSDETLARVFDYAQQIRKTPIVVNDSLGFFTSRTFGAYVDEGFDPGLAWVAATLPQGGDPARVEALARAFGEPP